MEVLIPAEQFQGEVTGSLTTKFVRDWRLKQYGDEKKWMRRSRFVAREFATSKRLARHLFTFYRCPYVKPSASKVPLDEETGRRDGQQR